MPTMAELFAQGYQIGQEIPRRDRAYRAAKEKYGAVADNPELFEKLQAMDLRDSREERAQQGFESREARYASQESRAQSQESRTQGKYDFTMKSEKANARRKTALKFVSGLIAARDRGEDVSTAFDDLQKSLPELGIDPEDVPEMKRQVVENPKILDSYLAALQGGTPLKTTKTADKKGMTAKQQRDAEMGDTRKTQVIDDLLARIDVVADPANESVGRTIFGMPGTHSVLTGGYGRFGTFPGSKAADYQQQFKGLDSDVRSVAFETLKGGGQITEAESQFAKEAIANLDRHASYESNMREVEALRHYMLRLKAAAEARLSGEDVPDQTTPEGVNWYAQQTKQIYPGFVSNGMRFKGGADPGDKNNWEPVGK